MTEEEQMVATRALWIREEEAWELALVGELTGEEALLQVVAPSPALLEASIEKAEMRPFAPRDFPHGAKCVNGHRRTPENTFWHGRGAHRSLRCLTCNNEGMQRRALTGRERERARKSASYHRRKGKPGARERKNAQNRAYWIRKGKTARKKLLARKRAAETDTAAQRKTRSGSSAKDAEA